MEIGKDSQDSQDILNSDRAEKLLNEEINAMNAAFRDLEKERESKVQVAGKRRDWIDSEE